MCKMDVMKHEKFTRIMYGQIEQVLLLFVRDLVSQSTQRCCSLMCQAEVLSEKSCF